METVGSDIAALYTAARFERLIAAYAAHDVDSKDDRTVREFVSEFRGLSGTAKQKQVLEGMGLARERLSRLVVDNAVDTVVAAALLAEMRRHSKRVKPAMLGVIGREHFQTRFEMAGCEMESLSYNKVEDYDDDNIPFVIEVAFGWLGDGALDERRLVTGVNWSPGIINPFRQLGTFGQSLDSILSQQRVDRDEPVVFVLHVCCPRVEYLDRGEPGGAVMKSLAIISAVQGVTKKWAKQRKAEERHASARENRIIAMTRSRQVSIRDAAWDVMEQAYMRASADGTLPANARQVMYAARPYIQSHADKPLGSRFDQYFTQTLLPDYIEENEVDRDVVYDDRGHFREPHGTSLLGLGTRDYLGRLDHDADLDKEDDFQLSEKLFSIRGPKHRFGAILFIEKEGFMSLFDAVQLAERFDIAIMSTKGVSVTAARYLVDELCGQYDIPLLVLHDFDKSGFTILGTLQRDTRRYSFCNDIEVIDLGLRLGDIDGLETETVHHHGDRDAIASNLWENGATDAEIDFLMDNRVELNAMTSPQLVAFIERKLTDAGVAKVIPELTILERAYRRVQPHIRLSQRLDELRAAVGREVASMDIPGDLPNRVRAILAEHPELPWEEAVRRVIKQV